MSKANFPFVALALGLFLMGILYKTGAAQPGAELVLPLLTVLIISEFGFILMMWQAMENGCDLVCGMLGVEFMMVGLNHWPGQLP